MDVAYSIAKSEGVRIKSDSQWEHYWNLAVRQIDGHPWRSPLAQKLLGEGLRRSPELAQMFTENELYDYASMAAGGCPEADSPFDEPWVREWLSNAGRNA